MSFFSSGPEFERTAYSCRWVRNAYTLSQSWILFLNFDVLPVENTRLFVFWYFAFAFALCGWARSICPCVSNCISVMSIRLNRVFRYQTLFFTELRKQKNKKHFHNIISALVFPTKWVKQHKPQHETPLFTPKSPTSISINKFPDACD